MLTTAGIKLPPSPLETLESLPKSMLALALNEC